MPQVERLDSKGEFGGFAVTDTLTLDGDRVVDAAGQDRGEAGKEQMNE